MDSIIKLIEKQIIETVINSANKVMHEGLLPNCELPQISVERTKDIAHGDFSVNFAMQTTKIFKRAPRQIAELIINNINKENTYISKVECAGPGFINFYLDDSWLIDTMKLVSQKKDEYGKLSYGNNKKVMVEFVSANPTGPLHMGNARGGALGDCIAKVLKTAGYDVTKEFYVNDTGNQIDKFGVSLEARFIQEIKGEEAIEFPEDAYQGIDIIEHAKEYIKEFGQDLINEESDVRQKTLIDYALPKNLERIKAGLDTYRINYDVWFSEKTLYESKEVDETIKILKESGKTFEKDGALWIKAEALNGEKDEVLIRQNGKLTYFTADIAYHRNKIIKRGFDRVINLWGADHHGHVARMKGGLEAVGIDKEKLDVIIFQLVRLFKDGEMVRMSKRTGRAISLQDLLDEVGVDAARFFFNMKASGTHLDFDMDLAKKRSNENPVYYVQYAHARICSILSLLSNQGIIVPKYEDANLSLLIKEEEKNLIRKIAEYPEEILLSAQTLEPNILTRYSTEVASCFHSFYNACKVKDEEEELMKARLLLVDHTRVVIKNVLKILGITAPERM